MNVGIHDSAAVEIQHHLDWYDSRNPRVADRLADLFEAAVVQIALNPFQFPLMEMRRNPGNIRRARLKGFPLFVLYRVQNDEAQIFAVPHASQRPGYWKSRLN